MYCPMDWENLFSCLFTQYKFVNEEIFMTVLQKYKLNPPHVRKITKKLYKILKQHHLVYCSSDKVEKGFTVSHLTLS